MPRDGAKGQRMEASGNTDSSVVHSSLSFSVHPLAQELPGGKGKMQPRTAAVFREMAFEALKSLC